ncbi:hypothetical protein SLEP1_g50140 [Rubroshorea leprosula]|uniref:Uncharacterized protein n=1 Tax=Rubroshorea leprosula TaxID=152421 RepID=A0AAV5LZY0_9ROSI|nr:hypothetical protein SLEP1_g50140 [Rubroshorea leprosula]
MYKVSSTTKVTESDILAAMEQAIADGVEICHYLLALNPSLYLKNLRALLLYHPWKKGLLLFVLLRILLVLTPHLMELHGSPLVELAYFDQLTFGGIVTLGNGLAFEGSSPLSLSVYIA